MSSLHSRWYGFLPLVLVASAALLGCAGTVVSPGDQGAVASEAEKSGGAGGAGTTAGGDCDALAKTYEDALTAAAACDACGVDGCSSGPVYPTPLGCNVVLNFDNLSQISTAKLAYWSWRDAGCVASRGECASGPPGASSCAASGASSCAGRCTPPPSP